MRRNGRVQVLPSQTGCRIRGPEQWRYYHSGQRSCKPARLNCRCRTHCLWLKDCAGSTVWGWGTLYKTRCLAEGLCRKNCLWLKGCARTIVCRCLPCFESKKFSEGWQPSNTGTDNWGLRSDNLPTGKYNWNLSQRSNILTQGKTTGFSVRGLTTFQYRDRQLGFQSGLKTFQHSDKQLGSQSEVWKHSNTGTDNWGLRQKLSFLHMFIYNSCW